MSTTETAVVTILSTDILLGDVIQLTPDPYGWATVVQIKAQDNELVLFRPYVHLGGFVYTGGVLHYIGTETFSVIRGGRSYAVHARTHEQMLLNGALS